MPDVLPDVDAIPDTPQEMYFVKRCLRWLNDRLQELKAAVEKLQAVVDTGQAVKLADLEKRVGVLERVPAATAQASVVDYTARATRSSNQSIPNNTWTAVSFDTEEYDDGGLYSSANPTRFTALVTGRYHFGGNFLWAGVGTGNRITAVWKNGGSTPLYRQGGFASTVSEVVGNVATLDLALAAGDYLELMAFQDSGIALDLNSAVLLPAAWMHRVDHD